MSAENSEKSLGGQGSAPNPAGELTALPKPVMCLWSETVGLKTGLRPKKSVLVLEVLCFVVKYNRVTLVVIMISEDTAAFQVLV